MGLKSRQKKLKWRAREQFVFKAICKKHNIPLDDYSPLMKIARRHEWFDIRFRIANKQLHEYVKKEFANDKLNQEVKVQND